MQTCWTLHMPIAIDKDSVPDLCKRFISHQERLQAFTLLGELRKRTLCVMPHTVAYGASLA